MAPRTALFADGDRTFCWKLKTLAQNSGIVADVCTNAEEARRKLLTSAPTLFITNTRLGPVRGGDLVHLVRMANPRTRIVLYGGTADLIYARTAQQAGAFFEPVTFLAHALKHYFAPSLPAKDRREPSRIDRRRRFRGGRRATDLETLHSAHHAHLPPE